MPSPERGPSEPPPQPPALPEQEPLLYYQAARFSSERPAGRVYTRLQDLIFRAECDLSAYRFLLGHVSHVAAVGNPPSDTLERRIKRILATGIATTLPNDILRLLAQRRAEASKLGPWVERHMRPGEPLT